MIGFILFIAISGMIIGLFMTILTSSIMGFWLKVFLISVEVFIVFSILSVIVSKYGKETKNKQD